MSEEKIRTILEAMGGITYGEWKKLKHVIDMRFDTEASSQNRSIQIAGPDVIVSDYKREF